MGFSPYSLRRCRLLVAGVIQQSKTESAVGAAVCNIVGNNSPLAVKFKDGRFAIWKNLIFILVFVYLVAVYCILLEVTQMVSGLPEEFVVPQVAYEVCLKEGCKAFCAVFWGVYERISIFAGFNLLMVIE